MAKLVKKLAIKYIQTKIKFLSAVSKKKAAEKVFEIFGTPFFKSAGNGSFAGADEVEFILQEKKITGYRWNHPQPRKVLVLHGFASASSNFVDYANRLVAQGFEVLAFDAPAHGKSEGKQTNAVEYSELIEQATADFGPVNYFVCHSFGGISLSLALEKMPHDERTKVVFIAPATETTTAVDNAFSLLQVNDPDVRAEFDKIVFRLSGHNIGWFSMRRAMHNIRASVLWIHDEADMVTPWADAEKVRSDNHPNIKFVVTKGLGHSKIYRDNEVKNLVVEFLQNG